MKVKTSGDVIKLQLGPEDMGKLGISQSIVWPALNYLATKRPELVRPVEGTVVELDGEIRITIKCNRVPGAKVDDLVDEMLRKARTNGNGAHQEEAQPAAAD